VSGFRTRVAPVISASRLSPWRLVFVVLAVFLFANSAFAQTDAYAIRGNATAGSNNIWVIDLTTGVETLVYTGYPGGNAATLAQRPSDGMLFYSINATNGAVYSFNPATPNVAPVAIGNLGPSTAGVDVSGGFRMAFNGNTLYYMVGNAGTDANTVYTLNQNTGQATKVATVTGTNNGGDIAFNSSGTLFIIDQDKRICSYAGLPANGAASGCSTVAVGDTNSIGLAFDSGGQQLLQTVTNANLYRGTTLITALSGGNTATGDLASANVPAPNLSITKTDGVTTVYRGGPVSYTVVITNSSAYGVTGTIVDTVPASVTGVNWTCVTSAGSFCAATSGSGNSINTSATLEAGDTATYTITGTLSSSASGTLVNTATVAVPAWLTDSAPANNTATDTDTINLNANLGITKTDGVASINSGSPVTYTIVVSNAGPDASNGSIVTDTVPATITGVTWTCGSATGGATCGAASGSGNAISTTANLPASSSVTYTVTGTLSPTASGTLTNTATVLTPASGVSDPTDLSRTGAGNNSATDSTPITSVPDLQINKSHAGNFTVGVNGTYTITANNAGTAATSATVTVTDNLPAGLTVAATPTGTGWNCSGTVVGSSTVTCTRASIAGGTSAPAITVTVVVAPAAFPSVTNVATVSGGGEPASNNFNNSASDPTTVNGIPDMTVAKSHTGNFTQGQTGATYTITATNSGTLATSGTVTVVDTLPAGLTATAISGTGWICTLATLTCTRNNALAVGASYPVITVTVNVSASAPASVTNSVSVSGGGQNNTTNDTATDPTTINQLPDLTINKSHVGNFTQGQVGATYSLVATNSGTGATSGTVTVTDTLPAGLTATAISGTGWSCVLGTLTCTRSDALAAAASYPAITVTVTVANNAVASVTNSAAVSGGGQTNTANDTDTDPTTVVQLPDLTITKSHAGNFTQGQVGATYSLTVTNSGFAATSGTVTVTDTLPAGLTATAISGTGWTCTLATLTCTRSNALAVSASYPVITVTVTVANNAAASVTNSVTVSGGGQTNTTNDTATDPTTINQLPDLTITKSHVGNFSQGQTGATYSITATNSGLAATSGTVTVVDTLPAGLTATAISGTGWACVLGTLTCTRSDALAGGASYPVITLTVNVSLSAAASVTNSVSISGGGQIITTNDTATDPTTINQLPDLTITKSHVGNFTQGQVGATYTLTATNSGFAATSGTVTVVDTLPAGLTATAISGTGWGCVLGTLTCTRSDALAAGSSYPVITVTVTVANNAAASVTNSVSVSGGGQTNTANDTATDPTTINQLPDLTINKSHVGNFTQGQVGATYSIQATNSGFAATSGTVTVTDTLPAGLTATAISGTGWACVLGTLTCTRNDALAAGSSYPAIIVTVTVANNAASSVTNSVSVSGGGQTNTANDSATDPTTINQLPDLTITKSHVGNFAQGQVGATYSITATNSGFAATSGTVTVVDTLPAGLTATAISGTGWSCTLATLTCTRSDALAAGSSYPVITVTVTVANNAAASVTNSVSISGGGQTNTTNDSATDPTTITQLPDLTITKSHVGNFTQGQVGATYSITATNSGSAATSGTVTVVDTLPAGLTATAISGTGWSCTLATLTCTRSDALAASSSYPVITVTVTVANNAAASVTNSATVSGGGQTNTANDTATNPTTINQLPDLTITKSHSGNFTQGQVGATYSITAANSGFAATSGTVTVVDTLPAGLTATAISGTGWSCTLATLTCTRSDALAAGSSYPVITVTVTVANNAASSVTNSVSISGGGQTNSTNDSATDPTTINQLPDLTITKSHVGNFAQGQVGATYSITATNSGSAATSGTVTVVDTLPAGLTATAINGTGWSCTLATLTCTRSDALAAGSSYPAITVTVTVANNAASSVTNSVSVSGGGQTNTTNDSATDPTTINQLPDLTITKSHVGNFTQGQVGATYSITATNSGSAATSGTVTVVDTLPAGLTATAISGTGWSCTLATLTCTRSDALAAGSSYPVITVTVNVANNAASSVTNSVTVSGGGQTNTANDTATNPTTINQLPDLTITKSHVGNFTQGQVGATYSITATNSGFAATSGTVTVVDTLPAGLTATAITGSGWACVLGTLTCTRSDALAAGSSYPAITVTVTVANNAAASVTNSVSVSGGGQTNTANDTATDPTTINQLPDLTIAKSHVGNFAQGQVGATYSITATNSGSAATSGTVTVVDTLPAGLTATAISGTGWSCTLATLTCTRSDALAASSSYPVITVTVTVANNAAASVTNSVSVSGGGQTNTANDTATDPTTINQLPDLTIAKSHVGNFAQGQVGATYSITATNSGSAATSGTVTVVDTLPAGLSATAISGTGWSCTLATLTCTRSDALAAGSSYPVITVTVTVANNAAASVTNSVSVSGGGQTNTTNDSTTDPTTITQLPDLTITKSHVGNFTQGQTGATYTLTATNSGFAATSGTVTVVDTLPASLTATAISGTGWSCTLATLTCTRSDALAAGSSYPVITVTVNVALSAPASVTNTASVSGGGQTNTANDTVNDPTTINTAAPPSIGLVKSVSPGGTQLPGTDLLYTIVYTNTGGQPANNFVIIDPNPGNAVPAERVFHNVDFKVGSLTSSPGTSGLVASFQYSNDGGATWTYTPVSGAGGAPAGYDRTVTNVRWSFAGSLSQTGPNNTGSVTLTVRIR
jgi:uncharacterized repeat protein (TIGR01451 family)